MKLMMPETPSFSDAIAMTQALLRELENKQSNEKPDDRANDLAIAQTVTQLMSTKASARGFLATLLTYDGAIVDHPPAGIIEGLQAQPEQSADLIAKNLAMSSAMVVVHQRNHDHENFAGSRRVQQRTRQLIEQLSMIELNQAIDEMISSLDGTSDRYQPFFYQQSYDNEQREELKKVFESLNLSAQS
ncbi:MAG: hypothetical protein AAFU78_00960 [Cyanobacteria bacterium J06633_2]